MSIGRLLAVAVALLIGMGSMGSAQAQTGGPGGPAGLLQKSFQQLGLPKEFSATMEMQGGPLSMPVKVAVRDPKARMEISGGPTGAMIAIHDGAAGKSYTLFPATKTYMESPLPPQAKQNGEKAEEAKVTFKELGEEQKDGHPCTKRLASVTQFGKTYEPTIWNAKDLQNALIRIEVTENGQTMAILFKDYDLKSPDDSLFQVPADYKKQ